MKDVRVTQNALLRHIEIVFGVDIEAIRAEIAAKVQPAIALGARLYSVDGITYVIQGDAVVAINDAKSPRQNHRRGAILRGQSARARGRS